MSELDTRLEGGAIVRAPHVSVRWMFATGGTVSGESHVDCIKTSCLAFANAHVLRDLRLISTHCERGQPD